MVILISVVSLVFPKRAILLVFIGQHYCMGSILELDAYIVNYLQWVPPPTTQGHLDHNKGSSDGGSLHHPAAYRIDVKQCKSRT
jgi:hypothetical protein